MASITKHASGYRAQVYVKGERASEKFRTKREAEAWAAAKETELRARQGASPGDRYTFAEAMRRYGEEVSPTKRGHRWEMVRIEKFLKDPDLPSAEKIGRVTPEMLGAWRDARLRQVSAGSVLREFGLLGAVMEAARLDWRWISSNPVKDVRKPSAPAHREVTITRAQIRKMLVEMGYRSSGPITSVSQAVAICFLVALRTGMRAGELCGLEWDRVFEGYCRLPVTKTVPRDVPLTAKAMRLIGRMKGWDRKSVFCLRVNTLDSLFRRYRIRAGLEGFTFHDSRHTAATWIAGRMKSSGLPAQQALLDLCKMFGWSSMDRALTYYNPSAADIAKRIN